MMLKYMTVKSSNFFFLLIKTKCYSAAFKFLDIKNIRSVEFFFESNVAYIIFILVYYGSTVLFSFFFFLIVFTTVFFKLTDISINDICKEAFAFLKICNSIKF